MKTLTDHLSQYAAYHRDRRNIATHFVGIPMIVFAVVSLLSRPGLYGITPAMITTLAVLVFYVRLDLRYGLAMLALLAPAVWAGTSLAAESTAVWLGGSIGLFAIGWVIQFIGHYFEGKKPAFVDDLVGLVVGPLFVVAEAGFLLGLRPEVREEIERRAGPLRSGPIAAR